MPTLGIGLWQGPRGVLFLMIRPLYTLKRNAVEMYKLIIWLGVQTDLNPKPETRNPKPKALNSKLKPMW